MLLNRQLVFLYVTLAVSVGYLVTALSLGAPVAENGLTPAFFPILVGGAAIVFCSILILQALRASSDAKSETKSDTGPATPEIRNYTHLWVVVAIFFYILGFKPLGYFLSSGLFVFALILLFSKFDKLLLKALISAAVVGTAYLMFQQLFGVRLPTLWG
ncbi:tripartite tricarboxylate transporter TctB family protein [Roseovarius nubinhibens]|uniref:tripartite tricarboxylate transporter TctB family protein n=1 Tax=Roseovarius nubinhibens TaxID=314263 RepID=UPI001C07F82A|nr:tripartite tricarboxylate transporter TctB family protein [Roseovarius nubinhibens]MBU2999430.1 tripartite tricarboxylate transporter TctB family protein [Roseovarius nubinhibens]